MDRRGGVRRLGEEEPVDGNRGAWRRTAGPGRPRRALLRRGHEDVLVAGRVDVQVRRLARDRARREGGVGPAAGRLSGEAFRGRPDDTGEDLVPDAVRPAVERAVADKPLLL